MATGEAIITGELMATREAEEQSVQKTHDGGGIAAVCWPSSQLGGITALLVGRLANSSLVFVNICCLRVGP